MSLPFRDILLCAELRICEPEILAGGLVCVSRYFSIPAEVKSSRKSAIRLQLRFPGDCHQKRLFLWPENLFIDLKRKGACPLVSAWTMKLFTGQLALFRLN